MIKCRTTVKYLYQSNSITNVCVFILLFIYHHAIDNAIEQKVETKLPDMTRNTKLGKKLHLSGTHCDNKTMEQPITRTYK